MTVVTRFAPSPTGYLHIGGARTALFNYLFAKHHGGKYLLRIEDTDRERSTQDAVDAILEGLAWLDLPPDAPPVYQYARAERHRQVVQELLDSGNAYYCYCSPEELEQMRETARLAKKPIGYNGMWRDRDPSTAPSGVHPVVRLKSPQVGTSTIADLVQGEVCVDNRQLDDFVLLRADGNPTYMLSVVIDDHDMGITHIIRGDDHLTNAFRQKNIYEAMGWPIPQFAHIPLIHGSDGAKLSKRHGALGVQAYKDRGLLPQALCNYLLKLGWGHGDDEIISRTQAINWFDVGAIGKAAARFDVQKLLHLNGHYIRQQSPPKILENALPFVEKAWGSSLSNDQKSLLHKGIHGLQERAKDLCELAQHALVYITPRPITIDPEVESLIASGKAFLPDVLVLLSALSLWERSGIEKVLRDYTENKGIKFGVLAQALRAGVTGKKHSPGIFEVLEVFGKEEALGRIQDVLVL
ncbi:MAG: glutamate--tRNA ligase [Alphaproteobacteria bacterium]|nr:MAG: glutamate--tRNA ligase [Alphaproteobacteria bacterium]